MSYRKIAGASGWGKSTVERLQDVCHFNSSFQAHCQCQNRLEKWWVSHDLGQLRRRPNDDAGLARWSCVISVKYMATLLIHKFYSATMRLLLQRATRGTDTRTNVSTLGTVQRSHTISIWLETSEITWAANLRQQTPTDANSAQFESSRTPSSTCGDISRLSSYSRLCPRCRNGSKW